MCNQDFLVLVFIVNKVLEQVDKYRKQDVDHLGPDFTSQES